MVDVANRRCETPGCNRHPSYAMKGDRIRRFCSDHKTDTMINVKKRKVGLSSEQLQECFLSQSLSHVHMMFISLFQSAMRRAAGLKLCQVDQGTVPCILLQHPVVL